MEFGIPKEVRDLEMRVGLTPAGVSALAERGHRVYVERGAGTGAGFGDEEYRRAGAHMVYSAAEVYGRADAVLKVTRPTAQEHHYFREGQAIFCFLHLSVSSPDLLQALWERQITAIAYEMIEEADDLLPILLPMSQIAGRLAPIVAGQLLTTIYRGRGILLSGLPGVPAAAVVILGGGVLGSNAARAFLGLGSQVTILDRDLGQLQRLDELFGNRINTMVANEYNIKRTTAFADVLVGAVLRSGRRAPVLVSRAMVRDMTPGSVIIDFSIDQGGCVATSRPTTLRDQYYVEEGVIHHCVPNFTAVTARTSSYAITNTVLSYLLAVAKDGLPEVFAAQPALRRGVNVYVGRLAHPEVAAALGRNVEVEVPGNAQDEENL